MISIFVLQRGFIHVGYPERGGPMGERIVLRHSANIRRYGGNGGLDLLATEGPKHATLDNGGIGTVKKFHELTVVFELVVDPRCEDDWSEVLGGPKRGDA